jgi:hypothetical protein
MSLSALYLYLFCCNKFVDEIVVSVDNEEQNDY